MIEYTNSQISQIIDDYIHSKRDRAILKRRLIDGICYEPLAEEFDMSVAQIKRIIYKGEDKIFRHIWYEKDTFKASRNRCLFIMLNP